MERKEGIPTERGDTRERDNFFFIIIYLAQPIIAPLRKHFEQPNNSDVDTADNHNYYC